MFSGQLMMYGLVGGGAYLLVITLLLNWLDRKLSITASLPADLIESSDAGSRSVNFIMELLFYVAIPMLVYSFFYFLLPFYGLRAGLAAALFAFVLGAVPALLGLAVRVKLPLTFVLFLLVTFLVKLAGTLGIIGYLYSL